MPRLQESRSNLRLSIYSRLYDPKKSFLNAEISYRIVKDFKNHIVTFVYTLVGSQSFIKVAMGQQHFMRPVKFSPSLRNWFLTALPGREQFNSARRDVRMRKETPKSLAIIEPHSVNHRSSAYIYLPTRQNYRNFHEVLYLGTSMKRSLKAESIVTFHQLLRLIRRDGRCGEYGGLWIQCRRPRRSSTSTLAAWD